MWFQPNLQQAKRYTIFNFSKTGPCCFSLPILLSKQAIHSLNSSMGSLLFQARFCMITKEGQWWSGHDYGNKKQNTFPMWRAKYLDKQACYDLWLATVFYKKYSLWQELGSKNPDNQKDLWRVGYYSCGFFLFPWIWNSGTRNKINSNRGPVRKDWAPALFWCVFRHPQNRRVMSWFLYVQEKQRPGLLNPRSL